MVVVVVVVVVVMVVAFFSISHEPFQGKRRERPEPQPLSEHGLSRVLTSRGHGPVPPFFSCEKDAGHLRSVVLCFFFG